ncbi:TRAP transporter small permease [Yoonia sp. I 8.24]|uniref:TRAP transporter small permease n=1 Tax=Yoonia sp. I 8.24 TaxID=1537229 RepID=UPI001EDDD40A|nr:TRAP transporter small permease [Yoonia sp. I 8.24]MCG3267925.1 TRAP transporter small permease [Yoonia sp. I 8.24]
MKFFNWLEIITKYLAGFCLFAVFVLVTAQVGGRFLFNFSFAAASELSIYAMIWSVFLGAAVAFRSNNHIAMDIIKTRLPKRAETIVDVVIFLLLVAFLCLVVVKGHDLALRAMRQTSPAARIPVGYITMAMPVGSVIALVFLCEQQVQKFLNWKKP